MKKIVSFAIALLLITACFSLTACVGDSHGDVTSDSEDTTAEETTQPEKDIVIAASGESVYSLIRYIDAGKEEVELIVSFKKALNDKFDLSLDISSDWTMPNLAPPADAPEIIIGLTCRDATAKVISEQHLGCGDCAVSVLDDNKIVIVAPDYKDLKIGFDYFLRNVSSATDAETGAERVVYTGGNYLYEVEAEHLWKDSGVAPTYRIVYDKDGKNKSIAESIAKSFNKIYDFKPEVVCETEAKAANEIIVGVLDDKSRFAYNYEKLNDLEYEIVTSEDSILLAATTDVSLKTAADRFVSTYLKTGNLVSLNLPVNTAYSFNTFGNGNSAVLTAGADTRIMSFNILSEEWDSAAVLSGRDVRVSAAIMNYRPDVAALQEVSNAWYPILDEYIGEVYEFTRKKIPSGEGLYTTLIYNKETTLLIEEGIHIYSVGNSPRLRLVEWGLFESIATKQRYIVFSTHWDVNSNNAVNRVIQAQEMAKLAKDLYAKYNVDVFACGDYNSSEDTTEYKTFLAEAGFVDAKTNAQKINRACKTYHKLFTDLDTGTYESIDHITFFEHSSSKVLFYNTLKDDYIIAASDHCPIIVDIKTQK